MTNQDLMALSMAKSVIKDLHSAHAIEYRRLSHLPEPLHVATKKQMQKHQESITELVRLERGLELIIETNGEM